MKRIIASLLILLLLCALPASAEDAQADLQARFGGQATLEYNGKSYAPRKRISTMLFGACKNGQLQLAYLVIVDDEENRIATVSLDPTTAVEAFDGKPLSYIYSVPTRPEDETTSQSDADARRLLEAVNSLLPEPLIENFVVLDVAGLDLLDGGEGNDPTLPSVENTKQRLKEFGKYAMQSSSSEQMDMASALTGYFDTDVKTGAMVKLMDKASRYEVLPTLTIPGERGEAPQPAPADAESAVPVDTPRQAAFIPDEAALELLAVEYLYEESKW